MSNASSAEIAKARRSWKDDHLGMYLQFGGAEGHTVDVSDIGGHKFTTTFLRGVPGIHPAGNSTGDAVRTRADRHLQS